MDQNMRIVSPTQKEVEESFESSCSEKLLFPEMM